MKLTNEEIEGIRTLAKHFSDMDAHAGALNVLAVQSICTEILELRRLSEVSGDLEKRINQAAKEENKYETPAYEYGDFPRRESYIKGAHFVIPIIRAESKAEIKDYLDQIFGLSQRANDFESEIATQAAEIEKLKELPEWLKDIPKPSRWQEIWINFRQKIVKQEAEIEKLKTYHDLYKRKQVQCMRFCHKIAILTEQNKIMEEALRDISIGKKQDDIGLPGESIGWRMMQVAQKALRAKGETGSAG